MKDNGTKSLENVAYALFTHIAFAENKAIAPNQNGDPPTKAWILDTYAECLKAVQAPEQLGRM